MKMVNWHQQLLKLLLDVSCLTKKYLKQLDISMKYLTKKSLRDIIGSILKVTSVPETAEFLMKLEH